MAYSKKVVDKFENTLNDPRHLMLVDLIQKKKMSVQVWLEHQLVEML